MMAGEEDGSQSDEDSWLKDIPNERRLNGIAKWKQVCVMIAGIVMNVLLAWIIYMGVALAQGYVVEDAKPIVYVVQENSVAQKAGLEKMITLLKSKVKMEKALNLKLNMRFWSLSNTTMIL